MRAVNVNLLQAPRFHVRPPGPHVTPFESDRNSFPVTDLAIRKVTTQPPTRRAKPQMFELFVGVGAAGDKRPLVTLEVVGPRGRGSRFHPIQVLEGLNGSSVTKFFAQRTKQLIRMRYALALSYIGATLSLVSIRLKKGWNGRRSPARKNSAERVM
ncbi:hypothetical protein TIFTF001_039656 [Ficus carica]|uniref:Uncharacterized protein n=1 Tax=Ficus carica TaxID=3494 RepID=A0AA88JEA3_FICCA|nr:hypothetical protein TIFTF001_039656 [Ficus carica]